MDGLCFGTIGNYLVMNFPEVWMWCFQSPWRIRPKDIIIAEVTKIRRHCKIEDEEMDILMKMLFWTNKIILPRYLSNGWSDFDEIRYTSSTHKIITLLIEVHSTTDGRDVGALFYCRMPHLGLIFPRFYSR